MPDKSKRDWSKEEDSIIDWSNTMIEEINFFINDEYKHDVGENDISKFDWSKDFLDNMIIG